MFRKTSIPLVLTLCLAALLLPAVRHEASADHPAQVSCRQLKSIGLPTAPAGLSWTTATSANDKTKLDQWCESVGPAIFRGPEATQNRGTEKRGRVLVVNWNVHVGNGNLAALIEQLKADERSAGRGDPDFVFLLQEAFRRGTDVPSTAGIATGNGPSRIQPGTYDIQELAQKLDWWMLYAPSMRNGKEVAEDRGNAILSSLPLEGLEAIELPFAVQRRVAIAAIVNDSERDLRFRVTTMHLDTRAPMTHGFVFGAPAARNAQAKWIAESVRRFSDDGMPLIVGGDLNSYWGSLESSVDTLASVVPHLNCGTKTHASGFTLDHMFARLPSGVTSCRRANDRFESDHYPLVLPLDQW